MSFLENGGNGMYMPVAPAGGYGYGGNGFFGGDGAWLVLFIIAAMFGGFGGGWGGNGFDGGAFPWLLTSNNQLATQMQQGFDQNSIQNELNEIQSSMAAGFANAEVAGCNRAMDSMRTAYDNEIESLKATFGLQQSMDQCCCENRLATSETQALISREAAANRENVNAGIQSIKDMMCQDKIDAKNEQIAALQTQVNMLNLAQSQATQTAALVADNAAQTQYIVNRVAPYPIPSYSVANPYGYNYGPFYGANNGFGYVGFGNGSF